ncbi:Pantoate-beta-alanine ligase [Schizopora paradoxa]|uniref:Pantoate--beta-alanine ligase n=1 Tax=Schizopora paradoxa TaxID=27342 RepID=A0A0H2RD53_9AGAM|nr:Pantoate-beta-alanine ligase [Schizopora paradoxa]
MSSFGPPRTPLHKEADLPDSSIPVFLTLQDLREWRNKAFDGKKSVGFVPTMGALHDGHLSLVKRSLQENDVTVVSIFVNPTQFAPHEDLSTYPRTLPQDLESLVSLQASSTSAEPSKTMAVFVPTVDTMYPSSVSQVLHEQKGTFVEVKGFGEVMEGKSRPSFFRGVATVVTKLFNAVQPTNAYFGQKDIQQALLLRRMVTDLLMAYPTAETLHIIPTARSMDPKDGNLALSSRNAYLGQSERLFAPTLYRALNAAQQAWDEGRSKDEAIASATSVVEEAISRANDSGVEMRMDYVEMNDPETFDVVDGNMRKEGEKVVILSGAIWVKNTRLIDNILLGDESSIIY